MSHFLHLLSQVCYLASIDSTSIENPLRKIITLGRRPFYIYINYFLCTEISFKKISIEFFCAYNPRTKVIVLTTRLFVFRSQFKSSMNNAERFYIKCSKVIFIKQLFFKKRRLMFPKNLGFLRNE